MENVLRPLPTHVADWLSEQVGPAYEIRSYVRDLILEAYNNRHLNQESEHDKFIRLYAGKYGSLVPESSTKSNK